MVKIMMDRSSRIDTDGAVKATLDYLVRVELIPDDSQRYLDEIRIRWGHVPEGMRVTIRPMPASEDVS